MAESLSPSRLGLWLRASYGTGHVLNDICASMWFTYLLVFFHLVLKFDAAQAGVLMLVGQIADAIATPFVGIEVDRGALGCAWNCLARWGYGHRKTWHLVGTLCVLGSFPFIFLPCIQCETSHQWAQLIYYSAFVVIFQFGWASTQISHLSLIPHLSPHDDERTHLTAIRYSFTVMSNILVYVITWAVLHITSTSEEDQIGPNDRFKFQHIVLVGLAVGTLCSIMFHTGVPEPPASSSSSRLSRLAAGTQGESPAIGPRKMSPRRFLKVPQFYQVAVLYMCSRLFANLSQVYVPLYLHDSLHVSAEALATVPLAMFLSSFVCSLIVGKLNQIFGRKVAYLIGVLIAMAACIWVRLGTGKIFEDYGVYGIAQLLGAASSILLVTSLGVTADLIGTDTESGAFVYGAMSFADKLSNGLAVTAIQSFQCKALCADYYRDTLAYVCGGAALVGLVFTVTLVRRQPSRADLYAPLDNEQVEPELFPDHHHTIQRRSTDESDVQVEQH